jgi:hypothetical protein
LDYLIQRAMLEAGMDRRSTESFQRQKELSDIEYERQLELGDIRERRGREAETRQETRQTATEGRAKEAVELAADEDYAASTAVSLHAALIDNNYPPHMITDLMEGVQRELAAANPAMGARFGKISATIPALGAEDWTRRTLEANPRQLGASNVLRGRQLEQTIPGLDGLTDMLTNLDTVPGIGRDAVSIPPMGGGPPVMFPQPGVSMPQETALLSTDPDEVEKENFLRDIVDSLKGEGRTQTETEQEQTALTESRAAPTLGWGIAYTTDDAGNEIPRMVLGSHRKKTTWDKGTPTVQTDFVPDPSHNIDASVDTIPLPAQSAQTILAATGSSGGMAFTEQLIERDATGAPATAYNQYGAPRAGQIVDDELLASFVEALSQGNQINLPELFRRNPAVLESLPPEVRSAAMAPIPGGQGEIAEPPAILMTPDADPVRDAQRKELLGEWLQENLQANKGTQMDQDRARFNREQMTDPFRNPPGVLGTDRPGDAIPNLPSQLGGVDMPMQSIGRDLEDFRTPPAFDPTAHGIPEATAALGSPMEAWLKGQFVDKAPFGLNRQGKHDATEPLPNVATTGVRQFLAEKEQGLVDAATQKQNDLAARGALNLANMPPDIMERGQIGTEPPNLATADAPPVPGTTILAQDPSRLYSAGIPPTPGTRLGPSRGRLHTRSGLSGVRPAVDPTLPRDALVADQVRKVFTDIHPAEERSIQQMIMNMIQGESSGQPYDESGRVLVGDKDSPTGPSYGMLQLGKQAMKDVHTGPTNPEMMLEQGQLEAALSYMLNLIGGNQGPKSPTYGADSGITSARDVLAAYNMGPGAYGGRKQRFAAGTPALDEEGGIAAGEFTAESPYGPSSDYVQKALGGIAPDDVGLIDQYIQRYQSMLRDNPRLGIGPGVFTGPYSKGF